MTQRLKQPLILLVLCASVLLPGLGRLTMLRQQELRVALAARSMAETGNWFVPQFRDQPRLKKPPLMYWIVSAFFRAAGTTTSPLVARLPSALFGAALILAIYRGGAMLVGRRPAFLGSLVAATSFVFMRHARLAETDIALCLFTSLAVLCGYAAMTGPPSRPRWIYTGLFAGLGFLVKGPAALALPLLALATFAALSPAHRKTFLSRRALSALGVFALVAAPWYIAVVFSSLTHAAADRAITTELQATFLGENHPGPIYYYMFNLLKMMLPWSVLLPTAIWAIWRYVRVHRRIKFLLIWFLTTFAALSLVGNKQDHYSALLLPQSALMIGWSLCHRFKRQPSWMARLPTWFLRAMPLVYAFAGLCLVFYPCMRPGLRASSFWAFGLLLLASGILLGQVRPLPTRNGLMAVTVLMTAVGLHSYVFLLGDLHRPPALIPVFARYAEPYVAKARRVYAIGARGSQLEFYLGSKASFATNFDRAWREAESGDLIAVSGDRARPFPSNALFRTPVVDLWRQDLRCALYVKSAEPKPDDAP
ncbi:MAG: glycosyltransferase family 39 protein [Verrucomicrobiota bacterium]